MIHCPQYRRRPILQNPRLADSGPSLPLTVYIFPELMTSALLKSTTSPVSLKEMARVRRESRILRQAGLEEDASTIMIKTELVEYKSRECGYSLRSSTTSTATPTITITSVLAPSSSLPSSRFYRPRALIFLALPPQNHQPT